MSNPHRRIHPAHQAVVDRLEDRYTDLGMRFDTGFTGSIPVQASGRVGRRFFNFRFRYDNASLTIGSPNRRRDAAHARRDRIRALRAVRRFKGSDPVDRYWAEHGLTPSRSLDRHPSIAIPYAAIQEVTGEPYNGTLEQEEAEQLFIRLMDGLKPVPRRDVPARVMTAVWKGRRTVPMRTSKTAIRKLTRPSAFKGR